MANSEQVTVSNKQVIIHKRKRYLVRYLLFFIFSFSFFIVDAQQQSEFTLIGRVSDLTTGIPITGALVVQKKEMRGTFTDGLGFFTIKAVKTDTLVITLTGYQTQKLCYKDSIGDKFAIEVRLPQKVYALKPVTVRPLKTFEEIERDKSKLGTHTLPKLNTAEAISSPITFLYERFSKFAKNQRKVAELRNLEEKKDFLKELFRIYVKTDIIELDESEFDDFIMFMNLSEDFIKNSSQYDLTEYIKLKFDEYMWVKKQKR